MTKRIVHQEHVIHTRFNVFWMATFDDYDGAPDASPQARLMGTGATELVAIADLLDQARDLEPVEFMNRS